MADKYIAQTSGGLAEVEGKQTSAGAGDAGKLVALNSSGDIDVTMLPPGVGVEVLSLTASENLSAGDLINVWNDSGTEKARKADASNAYRAHGFVQGAVTSGQTASVYTDGKITGLTSLTRGATYYLATTAGGITTTIPTTATHIAQEVGFASSATELVFNPGAPVTRA